MKVPLSIYSLSPPISADCQKFAKKTKTSFYLAIFCCWEFILATYPKPYVRPNSRSIRVIIQTATYFSRQTNFLLMSKMVILTSLFCTYQWKRHSTFWNKYSGPSANNLPCNGQYNFDHIDLHWSLWIRVKHESVWTAISSTLRLFLWTRCIHLSHWGFKHIRNICQWNHHDIFWRTSISKEAEP